MRVKKFISSAVALLLSVSIVFGMGGVTYAAETEEPIEYVSLGASQTNGYGMRYYLDANVYENPTEFDKATANVYGYQRAPETAYPYLVKEALEAETGREVNLNQLAISSMRAEELHMLLDDSYYGDAYTKWRFYNDNGKGWFAQAEEGGLPALREAYQTYVANADYITVDIGVNNFGVYAINRITGNAYDADLTKVFTEAELKQYEAAKAEIKALILKKVGEGNVTSEDQLELLVDTFTYAYVGFKLNFDASMEKIYELNPDANVIVVSIPNMMYGIETTFEGIEGTIPLGEIFGAIVDMANIYTAGRSPYCEKYNYARTSTDGHVQTFLDDILAYNGDPYSLDQNMRDCFDVYDDDLHIRIRLQYVLAEQLKAAGYTDSVYDFVKAGEAGTLDEALVPYYDIYVAALYEAYDVVATVMQVGAELTEVDIMSVFGEAYDEAEDKVLDYIMDSVTEAVTATMNGQDYEFTFDETLLEDSAVVTLLSLGVRNSIGNSFFAHPNVDGHIQVKNAIMTAIKDNVSGKDVAAEEMADLLLDVFELVKEYGPEIIQDAYDKAYNEVNPTYYEVTEDSYYFSMGGSYISGNGLKDSTNTFSYRFASELGLDTKTQYKERKDGGLRAEDFLAILDENYVSDEYGQKKALAALTSKMDRARKFYVEQIEKADLITVAVGSDSFTTFAIEQMKKALFGTPYEMDWSRYLNEKEQAYLEQALEKIRTYLVENGMEGSADLFTTIVETYAYAYTGFSYTYGDLIDKIHEINPDAKVIIIGMYNAMDDLAVSDGEDELALGEYINYFIKLTNLQFVSCAVQSPNTGFVTIPDTETVLDERQTSLNDVIEALMTGDMTSLTSLVSLLQDSTLQPNDNGHEYIKDRLLGVIDTEGEPEGLLGDADNDGDIDVYDARLVLRYSVDDAEAIATIYLANADYNCDGTVNVYDARAILQYCVSN